MSSSVWDDDIPFPFLKSHSKIHGSSMFQSPPTSELYTIIPYNYGKSQFLMGKSPFLMGKSTFLMGKSH